MGKKFDRDQTLALAEFTIEHCGDAIIFHDCQGVILNANRAACRHLDYSEQELIGLTIQDINPDSTQETWQTFWRELRQAKTLSFEDCHRTSGGTVIPIDVTVNYLEFDLREYGVAFIRDITAERKSKKKKPPLLKKSIDCARSWSLRTSTFTKKSGNSNRSATSSAKVYPFNIF